MEILLNRPLRRRLALALALAFAGAPWACAGGVLAVLSSDSQHYREAYEGFQEEWGSSVPFVLLGDNVAPPPGAVVVAFGSRAAMRTWPEKTLLMTCLAPGARPSRRGKVVRVELMPEPGLIVDRLKKLLPRLGSVRVLWSSDFEKEDVESLVAAGKERGVAVLSERIENSSELPERLRSFSGRADALWLMPDPVLVNAENFATLREYAAAARVPFLAPTQGLAQQGATAALAASFREVGRAAAAALKARLRGDAETDPVRPERLSVTVNASAARADGLDLKAASGVDRTIP